MPGYYDASISNTYAHPKATLLSTLEDATPKIKCYAITINPGYDDFTGYTTEGVSALVASFEGSGEHVSETYIGEKIDSPEGIQLCDEPSEVNPSTSAGFTTEHSYAILYIDKPNLVANVGNTAPHDLAVINMIRKALRNCVRLVGDSTSFPDFSAGDRMWKASDIAAMQEWIQDWCGNFVVDAKITDASGLEKDKVDGGAGRAEGKITISQLSLNTETDTDFLYLCQYVATDLYAPGGRWGFRAADSLDEAGKPDLLHPGTYDNDPEGFRLCTAGDYVQIAQLKDLAYALEEMRGVLTAFEWTANGENNEVYGEAPGTDENWDDAVDNAEGDATSTAVSSDSQPTQSTSGSYTPITPTPTPTTTPTTTPTPTVTPTPSPTVTPTPSPSA